MNESTGIPIATVARQYRKAAQWLRANVAGPENRRVGIGATPDEAWSMATRACGEESAT